MESFIRGQKNDRHGQRRCFWNRRFHLHGVIALVLIVALLGSLYTEYLKDTREPEVTGRVTLRKTTVTTTGPVVKTSDSGQLLAGSSLALAEIVNEAVEAAEAEVKIEEIEVTTAGAANITEVTWKENGDITVITKNDDEPEEDVETEAEAEVIDTVVEYIVFYTWDDVIAMAKLLRKEGGGIPSDTEQSGVCWIVLDRVDSEEFPDSIIGVITQAGQFDGWDEDTVPTEHDIYIAQDVLERWNREKNGEINVGRTLPKEYLYFTGDGVHNYFTKVQYGTPYVWGSQLVSPYTT